MVVGKARAGVGTDIPGHISPVAKRAAVARRFAELPELQVRTNFTPIMAASAASNCSLIGPAVSQPLSITAGMAACSASAMRAPLAERNFTGSPLAPAHPLARRATAAPA